MRKSGFTLVETIVVVGIFSLIVATLSSAIVFFYRTNSSAIEQSVAVDTARRGVDNMVKDIREATYSEEGAFPLVSFGPNTFTFYSDIDSDPQIEQVSYSLSSQQFQREVVKTTGSPPVYDPATAEVTLVADDVRNIEDSVEIFTFYDASGNLVTDSSDIKDIRFVNVNLVVNINPNRLPNEFTLHSSATLRNLKTNL